MDLLTPERRSWLMSRIKSKNTSPELSVRHLVHAKGYRYRLHCSDLPGKPDLVFRRLKKVIFVHGCFWHHHKGCFKATIPKSNSEYWNEEFRSNLARDRKIIRMLKREGWDVLVLWQCQTKNPQKMETELRVFLDANKPQ